MYEITLRGSAGPGTVTAFSDLDVEVRGGRTVLRGWLADQAALHGILERARRLGLELLEVRRVELPGPEDGDELGLRACTQRPRISPSRHTIHPDRVTPITSPVGTFARDGRLDGPDSTACCRLSPVAVTARRGRQRLTPLRLRRTRTRARGARRRCRRLDG